MKKLPIAKSVFKDIINENCCYADKTKYVKMLEDEFTKYLFLSRPRRFGKTLFLDTLRAAYAGEKELFKGLFLENNWDWDKKYSVITISLAGGTVDSKEELLIHLNGIIEDIAADNNINLTKILIPDRFAELIKKFNKKVNLPVVVLIDEYDKPILDNITNKSAKEIREGLASFYSVLKLSEKYLKFVFLTGVSKFSKTSIFSKLNNITDISLKSEYGDICGYTQIELEDIFSDYLIDVDLKKVKDWYNGYNFLGSDVYNPFDILFFLYDKKYRPYWFETGTPTFLLELIKEKKYFLPGLDNIELAESDMGEFDIDKIKLETLLYQTGYLTIKESFEVGNMIIFKLAVPNKEVQIGLNNYLLRMFFSPGENPTRKTQLNLAIYHAVLKKNPHSLESAFKAFFESVPSDWYRKNNIANYEGYYCSMFYAFFAAQGFAITPEDATKLGRIDFTVFSDNAIFIFEIKMKSNPKDAMEQLKEKEYHKKYMNDGKNIFLVGIEFDEDIKNISNFQCE